ncbi:MAG: hypothetical protein BWY70_00624 [Bacteroidetes bacterium ADurb.Bin408]|nr:MAG: hypothetical protein BWY70_00624 [Bacteroidetes bacterium ADurb.Bin408]
MKTNVQTRALFLICLLLSLFFLNNCKKKTNEVKFSGKVINPGSNQPVGDAQVSLSSTSVQSWVYNSNFQDIASCNSNQDGSFQFEFEEQAASAYRIYIYKPKYFSNTTVINANDVTSESGYYSTFGLVPEAIIKLHVKNQSPVDSADRILYKVLSGSVNCPNGCPASYIEGLGMSYDTLLTCKTEGDKYFLVESNITKGGGTFIRRDSVYMTPFDTTALNILY